MLVTIIPLPLVGGMNDYVYTVKMAGVVYVLHTVQKKSKQGIATPQQDMNLIQVRYKLAEAHYLENYDQQN